MDLKSFSDDFYKKICLGRLEPVLDSIRLMRKLGIWVEITTLIVPGQNDSEEEFKNIAEFIAGVGPEIPWHVSRFHPDYKYLDLKPTSVEILKKARDMGEKAGLYYIYLGNVIEGNNTYCYKCQNILVERKAFEVTKYNIKESKCPKCGTQINGRF